MNNTKLKEEQGTRQDMLPPKVKYCLYARKSSESEERQILSIDSQIKEMLQLAEREGLEVVRCEGKAILQKTPDKGGCLMNL